MRRNIIRKIIVHDADEVGIYALAGRVSEFHVSVIERNLNQTNLTTEQKVAVIDKIIDSLKSWETDGIIK